MKKNLRFSLILPLSALCLFPLLAGCAAVAISAAGAGAGLGLPYVLSDCADRTLNFSFDQVDRTAPMVLGKMDIDLLKESQIESGKRIKASANKLDITIDMEKVTSRATRVTINTKRGGLFKDKATAEEIINQMEKALAAGRVPEREKSPPRGKSLVAEKIPTKMEPIAARPSRNPLPGFQEGFQ